MVGQSNNVFKHIDSRASNAVTISTPVFAKGFAVDTIYSTNKAVGTDEALGNVGDDRYFSIFPKYTFGKSVVFCGLHPGQDQERRPQEAILRCDG